jgi:hypothetical protein
MGQYEVIKQAARDNEISYLKSKRKAQLYSMIWRDIAAIIKLLAPDDKAEMVSNHIKSMLYSIIEMKTGRRPDKI